MHILGLGAWLGRHWAAIAISATVLSLLVFVVHLFASYIRIILNIFVDTPPPLSMGPLDFKPLYGEVVRFRSFDGTSLRGMYLTTPNHQACKGTIVFCHEYGSDMYSCARYARPLIEAGFDVFTFDFRGHGESSIGAKYHPLQWPSDKEWQDTLGACAYVKSVLAAEGKPQKIGVFGISRGAGAALLAASTDPDIVAILCDGAFSTDTTVIAFMKRWAHIFVRVRLAYQHHSERFWNLVLWLMLRLAQTKLGCKFPSVRTALEQMQARPILFIHGEKDSYIRVDQTQVLYEAAALPKYLWIAPGAKHNQSAVIHPREYAARTVAFFRRHLAGEAVAEQEITHPAAIDVA